MPINPNALTPSEPDEGAADTMAATTDASAAAEVSGEEPKRKRRTKAELIADAVVPADTDEVEIKDAASGAKVKRPWLEAVELVKTEKAEWADKAMKYAVIKMEQQPVADSGAFDQPAAPQVTEIGGPSCPPEASLGDEVRVGSDTLRVGHGGVLTNSPIADSDGKPVKAKRRWQRQLGSGLNGPWESVALTQIGDSKPIFDTPAKAPEIEPVSNGNGAPTTPPVLAAPEGQEAEITQVSAVTWKVGTGILEKIGLPDYSSLQIGPISASRMVVDDGRRTTVILGTKTVEIPTAVVEVFKDACNVVEFVARYQRGELVSFLESTGALKQSVSA
jgi:hypothetical protein